MTAGGSATTGRPPFGVPLRLGTAVLLAVVTACGGGAGTGVETEADAFDPPGRVAAPATTTTTTATTSTTAAEPPQTQPPPPAPPRWDLGPLPPEGLGPGARGEQVARLEHRLVEFAYDVHVLDDVYDAGTESAVMAFQKVTGLPRTGRVDRAVADALVDHRPPGPLVPAGEPLRLEIDLPRQVLFLYTGGALTRILPVSTASGKRFCQGGRCRTAVTPPGSYRVGYRIDGWRRSPLGRLYNPLYYMTRIGIAIHGYHQVPPYPASHGCVRIPMFAAETLPDQVPDDTPVYVLDGKTPPAPAPPPGTKT